MSYVDQEQILNDITIKDEISEDSIFYKVIFFIRLPIFQLAIIVHLQKLDLLKKET
jgi:hypothetical protein